MKDLSNSLFLPYIFVSETDFIIVLFIKPFILLSFREVRELMYLLQLQVCKFNGPTLSPPHPHVLNRIRPPMYGNYGIKKFIKRNKIDKTKYFESLIYFC